MQNKNQSWVGYAGVVCSLGLLLMVFYLADYNLVPPEHPAPTTSVGRQEAVPDFTAFEQVNEKKSAFFDFLKPIIAAENQSIQKQREDLLAIYSEYKQHSSLSEVSSLRLTRLKTQYRLDEEELNTEALLDRLLLRVDEIPLPMVLAQAAIESAWGTSRFALVANNYFGQWCYKPGCGVIPSDREQGSRHEVAKFRSVQASVASYFRNINTHSAYRSLRLKRAELRERGLPISSTTLIQELERYSERGEHYIEELQEIISVNQLSELEESNDRA